MKQLIGVAALLLLVAAAHAQPTLSHEVAHGSENAVSCEHRTVATAVARFTALVEAGRYGDTASLWLPKRRLPTPGFFAILGRGIKADRGSEVPAAARRWAANGGRHVELIFIDPRVNKQQPANYGFAMAWFASSPGFALLGEGKGVWDCEKRRMAMFVGSERRSSVPGTDTRIANAADAREALSGKCSRRPRPLVRLYGQDVIVCGAAQTR